jgi:hypothetical protein
LPICVGRLAEKTQGAFFVKILMNTVVILKLVLTSDLFV